MVDIQQPGLTGIFGSIDLADTLFKSKSKSNV